MRSALPSDDADEGDEGSQVERPTGSALPIVEIDDSSAVVPDDELDENALDDDFEGDDGGLPDELLTELIEEEPRTVLITGAAGNIGSKLRAAWAEIYDLVLIDQEAGDDDEIIVANLGILDEEWITHFHGVDTVVHLAANPDDKASWDELVGPNLDTLANVLHAAALAGVERVIFASSNHVMGDYRHIGDGPISVDMPAKPDGPYGVTKLVGERMGRSLAHAFDLIFIAIRIGWVQEGKNRPDTMANDWDRQLWLSNGDLVRLFDCAVEAEIEDRLYVLVNGMSRNHGMRWDLSEAAELLGYLPEDDAYAESRLASGQRQP